ncbi:MAG: TIGR00645 family protein [Rickettsiales bacterium]|nr:TIGR00645 family protein [Rickettsiales bacterium]|tara:strand:- start:3010 stop:3516 length:507 start_codon:yes stop_codon:yes gene_type:complete
MLKSIEKFMERFMFASRWLLAPFYFGLIISLFFLLIVFVKEIIHYVLNFSTNETDLILFILTLIDLSFAGNLLIIVIFSGYENFVSKINVNQHEDKPEWMGTVDFGGLKLKLISSIVAISGIHLLKVFFGLEKYTESQIILYIAVHFSFVLSGVLLAYMDSLVSKAKK